MSLNEPESKRKTEYVHAYADLRCSVYWLDRVKLAHLRRLLTLNAMDQKKMLKKKINYDMWTWLQSMKKKHINKNKTAKGNNIRSHNSWEFSISYDKDNLSANLPSLSRSLWYYVKPIKMGPS